MWSPQTIERLLGLVLKIGVGSALGFFLAVKLAGSFDARLSAAEREAKAVAAKLDAHQAAMDMESERRAAVDARFTRLLVGICQGVNRKNPEAAAFCE